MTHPLEFRDDRLGPGRVEEVAHDDGESLAQAETAKLPDRRHEIGSAPGRDRLVGRRLQQRGDLQQS